MINKNRLINILILLIIFITFFLIFILKLRVPCIFKSILGISCPGCGMTRAVDELFNMNFIGAFKYNILSIPLSVLVLISIFMILYDIIKGSSIFITLANKVLTKYWYIFIVFVVIAMIINNISNIK